MRRFFFNQKPFSILFKQKVWLKYQIDSFCIIAGKFGFNLRAFGLKDYQTQNECSVMFAISDEINSVPTPQFDYDID